MHRHQKIRHLTYKLLPMPLFGRQKTSHSQLYVWSGWSGGVTGGKISCFWLHLVKMLVFIVITTMTNKN